MFGLGFLRPPTRGELKVIFFFAALPCFVLGTIGLIAGIKAPAEKSELAHQAIFYGSAAIFFGLVFVLCLWFLCKFGSDN
jgi:hypothetical protein